MQNLQKYRQNSHETYHNYIKCIGAKR